MARDLWLYWVVITEGITNLSLAPYAIRSINPDVFSLYNPFLVEVKVFQELV